MAFVDPNSEIRIFTPNCIDSDSTITVSHGGTISKIYDGDIESAFTATAIGGNRDTDLMTIDITFKINGVETEFIINSLILVNHNWRDWYFSYYKPATGTYSNSIVQDENTNDCECYTFGAIKTSRIRFSILKTIQPNQFKSVGEIFVMRQRFVFAASDTLNFLYREKTSMFNLADGSMDKAVTRFSQYRTQKWGARVTFSFLTEQQIENLRVLKNEAEPFLILPESVWRPKELYLVHWVNQFAPHYTALNKQAGHSIDIELQEV